MYDKSSAIISKSLIFQFKDTSDLQLHFTNCTDD